MADHPCNFLKVLAAAAFIALLAPSLAARADHDHEDRGEHRGWRHHDRDRDERDWDDHDRDGRYYRAPPVIYAPRYYSPPPVVYGPGFGVYAPGLQIQVGPGYR